MQRSNVDSSTGSYQPIETSAPASMGATIASSHPGSSSQSASVDAITSWVAAASATLRPREMFAPGSDEHR